MLSYYVDLKTAEKGSVGSKEVFKGQDSIRFLPPRKVFLPTGLFSVIFYTGSNARFLILN
jgi:hypothetical protein